MIGKHWSALVEGILREDGPGAVEVRFERALAAAGAVAWQRDIASGQSDLSSGAPDLLGLKDDPNFASLTLIHPDDRAWLAQAILAASKGEAPYDFEFRLLRPDGEVEWVRDRGQLQRDEQGRPLRLAGVAQRVTEWKRTEVAFNATFEQAAVGMAHLAPDGIFLKVNESLCRLLRRTRQELLATTIQEVTHPDHRDTDQDQRALLLEGGIAHYTCEKRYLDAQGSDVWCKLTASLVRDPLNRPDYFIAVVDDIGDRKRQERRTVAAEALAAALSETEAGLRLSQESGRIGSWAHDLRTGQVRWSDYQCRQFGVDPARRSSIDGSAWRARIHPDDLPMVEASLARALEEDGRVDIEYRIRAASGERWINGRGMVERDADGVPLRLVGVDVDITEQRILEEQLREVTARLNTVILKQRRTIADRTADLRRANEKLVVELARREKAQAALVQSQKLEALGQLTAGVAHDFNNAIAAISAAFSIIERRSDNPAIQDITRLGQRAAGRADGLVKQLLMFARQQTLELRTVDLKELLTEMEPMIRRVLDRAVALTIDCSQSTFVRVDPIQLESAIMNLAVNARDALGQKGSLSIGVRECPPDAPERPAELGAAPATELYVQDTGCGIPPEVLQRVVEPFFTTKPVGEGTGLGLAMVHGLMQGSGGALRISSQTGVGTTVSLYLPASEEPAPQGLLDPTLDPEADQRHGGATVLVVDDDPSVRGVMSALLSDLGYLVLQAEDGSSAMAAVQTHPNIDLILSDVVMPGVDGPAFAAAMRRCGLNLPIIFMTGRADRSRLIGETVIEKPFSRAILLQRLLEGLGRDRARADDPLLDRLYARMRTEALKPALQRWRLARMGSDLPRLEKFGDAPLWESAAVIGVNVQKMPVTFHLERIGEALKALPGGAVEGRSLPVVGDDETGSQEAAYRLCVKSKQPTYEYCRVSLGDEPPVTFERLVLPFSSDDKGVDRLVALVLIDGLPSPISPPRPTGAD